MTKPGPDMQQALDALKSKKRFRDINHAKLARILECAELSVPGPWLRKHADLASLPARKGSISRIHRRAWWAIVPVGAAAAALIVLMTGLFDFMGGRNSGTAGIVTGNAALFHGGDRRVLRAGDAVSRGDVVVTAASSSVDIHFGNLLHMRVLGGSRVNIGSVALKGARDFDVLVSRGGCLLDVSRLAPGETVSVHTPGSVGVVKGTRFGVMVGADGAARYEVFAGTVRVRRCLPSNGAFAESAARLLDRHFREHALDVAGGQACAIAPDPVPLQSISINDEKKKGLIASLALPELVRGAPFLRDDMESLVRSSYGRGVKSESAPARDLFAGREADRERGRAHLMYIPVLDCVVRFGDRYLMAARSGDVLWSVPLDGPVTSFPVFEATSMYVPTARGVIVKVDLFTGATQWKVTVPGGAFVGMTLTLDGSGLYCATARGTLLKYDRGGEILWSVATGEAISAMPVISEKLVFVSTRKGSLFGFDIANGSKAITVSITGSIISIAARKNHIFLATDSGRLYCYDSGNDVMLWEYRVNDALAGDMSVSGDSVYLFGRGGRIYRISKEGSPVWERNLGVSLLKRPTEDASSFYVPASESLFVVDKVTGDVTWSLLLPNISSANVAVSNGHIYFDTGKKRLSSLKK